MNVEMFKSVRALVIGDYIFDEDVFGECTRFAQEAAGCPVFAKTRVEKRAGGAGAVEGMLKALGAHVECIDGPYGSVKRRYFAGGRQIFRTDEDAVTPDADEVAGIVDTVETSIREFQPNVILISDYAKGVCSYPVVRAAIVPGIQTIVDPYYSVDWKTYRGSYLVKCNADEWQRPEANGKHADMVVVTLGSGGARLLIDGKDEHFPTAKRCVVDTTGAGDMFFAALGACIGARINVRDAIQFANHAAGTKVERHGAVAIPITEIIDTLLMNPVAR